MLLLLVFLKCTIDLGILVAQIQVIIPLLVVSLIHGLILFVLRISSRSLLLLVFILCHVLFILFVLFLVFLLLLLLVLLWLRLFRG